MASRRHFVNTDTPGATAFVTTTVLDHVHAFARDECRDAMVRAIARECKLADTKLHAYVVMPHHIHIVVQVPERLSIRQFMQRFKPNAGKDIARMLTAQEVLELSQQIGLNRNTFWQRSFRSYELCTKYEFQQKVDYIDLNPVKAGYVECPRDYRWSSARLFEEGLWDEESGLPLDAVSESVKA